MSSGDNYSNGGGGGGGGGGGLSSPSQRRRMMAHGNHNNGNDDASYYSQEGIYPAQDIEHFVDDLFDPSCRGGGEEGARQQHLPVHIGDNNDDDSDGDGLYYHHQQEETIADPYYNNIPQHLSALRQQTIEDEGAYQDDEADDLRYNSPQSLSSLLQQISQDDPYQNDTYPQPSVADPSFSQQSPQSHYPSRQSSLPPPRSPPLYQQQRQQQHNLNLDDGSYYQQDDDDGSLSPVYASPQRQTSYYDNVSDYAAAYYSPRRQPQARTQLLYQQQSQQQYPEEPMYYDGEPDIYVDEHGQEYYYDENGQAQYLDTSLMDHHDHNPTDADLGLVPDKEHSSACSIQRWLYVLATGALVLGGAIGACVGYVWTMSDRGNNDSLEDDNQLVWTTPSTLTSTGHSTQLIPATEAPPITWLEMNIHHHHGDDTDLFTANGSPTTDDKSATAFPVTALNAAGDVLVVGVTSRVTVYELSLLDNNTQDSSWQATQTWPTTLQPTSVAMNGAGTILAVGTTDKQVHVYQYKDSTSWSPMGDPLDATLLNDENIVGFGICVALDNSGTVLAVGATSNEGNVMGHVQVFVYAGNNTWNLRGNTLSGQVPRDGFGATIGLNKDGNILVVGADGRDTNDETTGNVLIFTYNARKPAWDHLGELSGLRPGDAFGASVDISYNGRTVAVGSPLAGDGTGLARVYHYNGSNGEWEREGQTLPGGTAGDLFGSAVSLSSNGRVLAVGAHGFYNQTGAVQVYKYLPNKDRWEEMDSFLEGTIVGDTLGASVALSASGTTLATGSKKDEGAGLVQVWKYVA